MATEFPYDVVLRAKAAMQQGINEALGQLKKFETEAFRSAEGATQGGGLGSLLETGLKFGVVINAVKGAFAGLNAAIQAARGDGEKFEESMARLPLGIGEAWRLGRELKNTLDSGARVAKELADEAVRAAKAYADSSAKNLEISKQFAAQSLDFTRQLRIANTPAGLQRDLQEVSEKFAAQRLAIIEKAREGDEVSRRESKRNLIQLDQLEAIERQKVKDKYNDEQRKNKAEIYREEQDFHDKVLELEADAQEKSLRAAGRSAEAEKLALHRKYDDLISIARGQDKARLQQALANELAAIKPDEAAKRPSFSNAVLVGDRFRGLAAQQEEKKAVDEYLKATREQTAKLSTGLDQVRMEIRNLPRNLPAGIVL